MPFGNINSKQIFSTEQLPRQLRDLASGVGIGNKLEGDDLSQIRKIQSLEGQQTFISSSLMGRAINIEKFNETSRLDWNQNFPYVLHVLQVIGSGYASVASFRLPINPQDLVINSQFASKVTVTSLGILEEHNGIPLKQININATTGIFLGRLQNDAKNPNTSIIGTLFAGTISAAQSFVSSVKNTVSAFGQIGSGSQGRNSVDPAQSGDLRQTGYFQYHMLRMFLESYAELKKSPAGKAYRLAFEMVKDKQTYLVTPQAFTTRKSASSPMEYQYSLNMIAWSAVDISGRSGVSPVDPGVGAIRSDIGATRRLFNALRSFRKTASKFKNIISNARADVESNIYGPINNIIIGTKEVLSIPKTIADFPKSLRDSFQTSVAANWDSLSRTNEELRKLFDGKMRAIALSVNGSGSALPFAGTGTQQLLKSSSLDSIDLTDAIEIDSLPLTDSQINALQEAIESALLLDESDYIALAEELQALSNSLSIDISLKAATDEEWDILYAIQDAIAELLASIADGSKRNSLSSNENANGNPSRALNALDYWEGSTQAAGIDFTKPVSKFAVPFPFRSTLEELSAAYLGTPLRWQEIAALNGLQYPYVDEDGFTYNFIANGSNNSFNIATNANLQINQTIFLLSDTQKSSRRKIQAINKITATNYQIVVDGEPDLANWTTADNAKIRAYLPNTINSMRQVYIPADGSPDASNLETRPITFIDDDPEMVKFSKIDLLLDSNFDLAITSDGFANLAFGKTNLLQAAKLKMATIAGTNLLHPEYGGGVEVGSSMAELDIDGIINRINTSFASDPRFNAPSAIDIVPNGDSVVMTIAASVRRGNGILPITIPLTE
jgi:hypothetical protein